MHLLNSGGSICRKEHQLAAKSDVCQHVILRLPLGTLQQRPTAQLLKDVEQALDNLFPNGCYKTVPKGLVDVINQLEGSNPLGNGSFLDQIRYTSGN
ncbi:Protein of unknown function [Cotesia congregata]|uniref:Uncharacterized protein n=1 Tax=Cotesia congregata TaxID=51543 RepID=A0A8J2EEA6_COTCN|nr:Protein of unknown function [Cotesia congregata]